MFGFRSAVSVAQSCRPEKEAVAHRSLAVVAQHSVPPVSEVTVPNWIVPTVCLKKCLAYVYILYMHIYMYIFFTQALGGAGKV